MKEQRHKHKTEKSALKPGLSLEILEPQGTGIVLPRSRKPSLHPRGGAEAPEGESQPGMGAGSSERGEGRAGKRWEQKIPRHQQEQLGRVTQRPQWQRGVVLHRAQSSAQQEEKLGLVLRGHV